MIYYTFKYTFVVKTTFLVLLRSQKSLQRLDFGKTSYNRFVLARGEFLRVVGARNEVLRLIITYYKFKYLFGIKTTLVESHQSQKTHLTRGLRKTSYKYLVFSQSDFLRILRDPNESLRLIIRYYMVKYSFRIKTILLESLWSQKKPLKGSI